MLLRDADARALASPSRCARCAVELLSVVAEAVAVLRASKATRSVCLMTANSQLAPIPSRHAAFPSARAPLLSYQCRGEWQGYKHTDCHIFSSDWASAPGGGRAACWWAANHLIERLRRHLFDRRAVGGVDCAARCECHIIGEEAQGGNETGRAGRLSWPGTNPKSADALRLNDWLPVCYSLQLSLRPPRRRCVSCRACESTRSQQCVGAGLQRL